MHKGQSDNNKPKFAGLDEINFTSAEEATPTTWFAGVAKVTGYPLMEPIIKTVKNTPQPGGKKG